MSVFRNVAFFRSDDGGIWAVRSHGNEQFNPDKHADYLESNQCGYSHNYRDKILTITDLRNGNKYISGKGWDVIQT